MLSETIIMEQENQNQQVNPWLAHRTTNHLHYEGQQIMVPSSSCRRNGRELSDKLAHTQKMKGTDLGTDGKII